MATLGTCQIPLAWAWIVRSEEKLPERAVFRIDLAVEVCFRCSDL
jgi:hypothetical protein